jgi:hypothetical protein
LRVAGGGTRAFFLLSLRRAMAPQSSAGLDPRHTFGSGALGLIGVLPAASTRQPPRVARRSAVIRFALA